MDKPVSVRDFAMSLPAEGSAVVLAMQDRIEAFEAEVARLREAIVQHNDRLRAAQAIASRDGADTNWLAFRGHCTYTLAEYHELVNECRQALKGPTDDT
jgi:hypothetical protein